MIVCAGSNWSDRPASAPTDRAKYVGGGASPMDCG